MQHIGLFKYSFILLSESLNQYIILYTWKWWHSLYLGSVVSVHCSSITRPRVHKTVLRGSGSRSAETTKGNTWYKPEKWCSRHLFESGSIDPTKWINLIPLVIDISCLTMHYGKFVCLLSTQWLPCSHFNNISVNIIDFQINTFVESTYIQFWYVLTILLQFIGWTRNQDYISFITLTFFCSTNENNSRYSACCMFRR